jgi:CheY-like chemotaxis protein
MPKRILLADDSITIQKVVELTFSDGDYEVTAVNNGARAIQKLGEMKPDIILSDIIMPEKNGYEVCEYVKSHPEYRTIPVVLLTGTFEPFDPDRAEKAGCDAVVTKPFESQSLIHKVEELIASTQASASTTPPPAPEPEVVEAPPPPPPASAAAASPWLEEEPIADAPSPFTTSGGSFPAPGEAFTHGSDIFGAAPAPESTSEMPFDTPAPDPAPPSFEATRAYPSLSANDLQQAAPSAEPSPWDEQPYGGETRAFEKMSVSDLESMQQPLEPQHPAASPQQEPESPFGAPPPAEEFSAETRAFERMSFEDLQNQAPSFEPGPEHDETMRVSGPSPWDEPADSPLLGGQTQAFPQMSGDQFPQHEGLPDLPADAEEIEQPRAERSPWDEQPPAFAGETRAFEKMSFDDFAPPAAAPEPEPPAEPMAFSSEPEPEAAPWGEPSEPAWSPAPEASEPEPQFAPENFGDAGFAPFPPMETESEAQPEALSEPASEPEPMSAAPMPDLTAEAAPEDMPFATEAAAEPEAEEPQPVETVPPPSEPAWSPLAAAEAAAEPEEPVVPPPALAPETPVIPIRSSELTDDQVDRIARRVIELMSDQIVRNIAWEVIPDLAEMVVKERIRQLESEA